MASESMDSGECALAKGFRAADRLKHLNMSGVRRFFGLANEMPDCIDLSVGEPDFSIPQHALDASSRAGLVGKTHYVPTNGIPELRGALAKKASEDYNLKYDPNDEVIVTVGATEAIFAALLAFVNPGDEVLVPNPGFILYAPCVRMAGGVPVSLPLLEERDFGLSGDDITPLITKKSRVIIVNSPNNPTGAVLTSDELASLAKIAVERDMIVISDEVYEKIVYDGVKHYCLAAFPGMRERTLVVNSFSKTYAMTGLRVGYVYGPKELMSAPWLMHQYIVTCVNSLSQYAALAALEGPQDFVAAMVREFDRRRRLAYRRINSIGGLRCTLPRGAFYAFPNVEAYAMSSEAFAEFLVREAHTIAVPGSAFGSRGRGYIRISYAAAYEQLEKSLDRIEAAVKGLK
jgi:aminotransferase